ncbi:MAG: hypothetical protein ABI554_07595 [Flavobacterium sp.]
MYLYTINPTFDGKSWMHYGHILGTCWSHTKLTSTSLFVLWRAGIGLNWAYRGK